MIIKKEDNMKEEIFDLCLNFHKELIRAEIADDTIDNAKSYLVNDDSLPSVSVQKRSRAKKFAKTIKKRLATLESFYGASWEKKCKLYKAESKRTPNNSVFDALKLVLNNGLKTGTAAEKCGVNFQSVKVLKPRFQRYNDYAEKLNSLTKNKESIMPGGNGHDPDKDPKKIVCTFISTFY